MAIAFDGSHERYPPADSRADQAGVFNACKGRCAPGLGDTESGEMVLTISPLGK